MSFRITRRGVQIALGLIWLLDGALQFQSYFYSQSFITQMIEPMAQGQPRPIGNSINWAARLAEHNLGLYDTLFGLVQLVIGLGLLFRPSVRLALLLSFGWTAVVWWFGEGFGMIPMRMASPLTGAPGAVLLYGLIGLLVWPTGRPDTRSAADGGPIGETGALGVWTVLWTLNAALWLQGVNRSSDAFQSAITSAEGSSMGWLRSVQNTVANWTAGHGLILAVLLTIASALIGFGVLTRFRSAALSAGIVLSLVFWVLGQSLGGLTTTQATDPNAGLLFILLALTLMPRRGAAAPARREPTPSTRLAATAPPAGA